ncbi:DUF6506 family protein [Phytoactinopolyspora limicola]|uniref:DUF6506 family protein n=1 Tax=Phytoactinopolyspora limicola TaxID=2715536 RepID=UPI001409FFBD|nr:DUF6506 family protein [Phytoactinopolyspora limicola]
MTTWAYIYEHPETDPIDDRTVIDRAGQRTLLVPVPDPSAAPEVALRLVGEGVELIELCGGFSLLDAARVVEAVGDHVPVGHVTFAVDAVPGVAAYAAKFEAEQHTN